MIDSRVKFGLDYFIEENYFASFNNQYKLEEREASGKSILQVTVTGDNLCLCDFDGKKRCSFLKKDKEYGMQKSVDHIILQKKHGKWDAHLIEMKTTVGNETWKGIKLKVRTSYLTLQAINSFLGIEIENFTIYTTYEQEKFLSVQGTTNPRAYKTLLGEKAPNFKKDEWDANRIRIEIDGPIELPHQAISMQKTGTGATAYLSGSLTI